ncbi:MAG TPA: hypothetical protein VMH41_10430 [Mycobacteriales bacterium]|nr:hypothetical protein [Mycobacteriales bacterium]
MTQQAGIYSAPNVEPYGSIEFSTPRWKGDNAFRCTVTVVSGDQEWAADLWLMETHAADLIGFFEEVGSGVGAWELPKLWHSDDHEIELAARRGDLNGEAVIDIVISVERDGEWRGIPSSLTVLQADATTMASRLRAFTGIEGRRSWHRGGDPPPWWRPPSSA